MIASCLLITRIEGPKRSSKIGDKDTKINDRNASGINSKEKVQRKEDMKNHTETESKETAKESTQNKDTDDPALKTSTSTLPDTWAVPAKRSPRSVHPSHPKHVNKDTLPEKDDDLDF